MRPEQTYKLKHVISGGRQYLGYDMPFKNLYDTLEDSAQRFPDKIALVCEGRSLTYFSFKEQTDRLAFSLEKHFGIKRGDRIALAMVNSIEFCVSFYAVLKLGATVVSLNTKMSAEELGFIIRDSEASFVISDEQWLDKVSGQGISEERIIVVGKQLSNYLIFNEIIERTFEYGTSSRCDDDGALAVIMYTSGTTGKPKGACMTHFNLMQGFYCYALNDDMDGSETTVASVPLFHITGLNNILTLFVFLGGTIHLIPFFNAQKVLDVMTQSRCTYFHAVATVYIMLASAYDDSRHDLSHLKDCICGGGFITVENIRKFCAIAPNCRFHPVYGMTETAGTGTYCPGHCLTSGVVDSCGKVSENCMVQIFDDDGNALGPNEDGEIGFKGAYIIERYLHCRSSESFRDGWLLSGDVGHFDEKGYLYITDRKKDMINRGGEKIFSLAVESAIMEFGSIKQACVFAVSNSLYQEVPAAVIIPEDGCDVDLEQLRIFLRGKLAHYKVPVFMEKRTELPSTANGKPRKIKLREEFNEKYGC